VIELVLRYGELASQFERPNAQIRVRHHRFNGAQLLAYTEGLAPRRYFHRIMIVYASRMVIPQTTKELVNHAAPAVEKQRGKNKYCYCMQLWPLCKPTQIPQTLFQRTPATFRCYERKLRHRTSLYAAFPTALGCKIGERPTDRSGRHDDNIRHPLPACRSTTPQTSASLVEASRRGNVQPVNGARATAMPNCVRTHAVRSLRFARSLLFHNDATLRR